MPLSPMDEFLAHQTCETFDHVFTSDRNFYDRYYFNLHGSNDDLFMVMGMGQYPNLGVQDAFAVVRRGTAQCGASTARRGALRRPGPLPLLLPTARRRRHGRGLVAARGVKRGCDRGALLLWADALIERWGGAKSTSQQRGEGVGPLLCIPCRGPTP